MAMIETMWGTCDGVEIIFTQTSVDTWECDVPADFQDGTYIVEIWAKTNSDMLIYTTAVLYICDAKCVALDLMPDGYFVQIKTEDYRVKLLQDCYCVQVKVVDCDLKLLSDGVRAVIQ